MSSLIKKAIKYLLITFFSLIRDILPKKNMKNKGNYY